MRSCLGLFWVLFVGFLSTSCVPTKPAYAAIKLSSIPKVQAELNTGPAPGRIANYYLMSRMTPDMVDGLAKYDILVLGLENAINNRQVLDAIRSKNPKVKMLFYVQSNEFPWSGYENNEPPDGPWHLLYARLDTTKHFLRAPDGSPAQFWPGTRSYNLCNPEVPRILAPWIAEQFSVYPWDGVFVDNIWPHDMTWYCSGNVDWNRDGVKDDMKDFSLRWIANEDYLGQLIRHYIGPTRLLMANIGGDQGTNHSFWSQVANGRMFEGFPNTLSLPTLTQAYLDPSIPWKAPGTTIVHCEANEDPRKVRFAWTFALLGNGAFAVDDGPNSGPDGDNGWHDELRWYPELYEQPVGQPVTTAFREATTNVWLREFEQGLVVWNPTPIPARIEILTRTGQPLPLTIEALDGQVIPFVP